MNRDTICVQGGYTPGNGEPRQIPIIQSTTFKYATSEDMGKLFDLEASGYFYSRLQNPTNDAVAARIAALEGGTAAMLTASGQAAIFFAVFNIVGAGDHLVSSSSIYGGSFNPPHLGHMAAAESAAKYLGLDELLLIPAGIPPHKMLSADAAGADDRLAMTRLMGEQIALDTGVKVTVSDMEIAREGKSYTADTLRILHEEHPDDELWLLMGTDMFLTFQYWYKPDEIMRYAGLCAFGRTEKDGEELFAPQRKYLGQRFPGSRIVTMTLPNLVDVSSTELRARIPKGETEGLLAPAVLGYIYRKHLYGTNLDLKRLTLEDLRPIALSYLKAKRIPHVLGTEQTAKALAEKYGADVEKARFAALLHDATKRLSMEEQLAMCEHYHIVLDELEQHALKLLHAKTGAALARDMYGADDEIYNAILWHTTGKANMTLLEKVIYLADYIEPSRDFDGVEDLRKVVWEDLDKGLEMGLAMTVEEMEQMGNPIHHNTLQALEYLRGHTHE